MSRGSELPVRRARSLVGVPFRPQGRDPVNGLDCVGLILSAFEIPSEQVRRDYRLRGPHLPAVEEQLSRFFRRIAAGRRRPGDVLLCMVARDQAHLAIDCGRSFVHADARLRRIVETPGAPSWPIAGIFRRRATRLKSS